METQDGESNNEDEIEEVLEENPDVPEGEVSDIASSIIRKKVTRNVGNTQRRRFR